MAEIVALIGTLAACLPRHEPWRTVITGVYLAAGMWGAAVLLVLAVRAGQA